MIFQELEDAFLQAQASIAGGPVFPTVTADEIRAHLARDYDFDQPRPLETVVDDVERMLRTWQVQVTHPRYFGLFNPSVTLASVVADTLVAMYNPQLANWRTSPAGNEIERHTLGWLAAKFGMPDTTLTTFTSGGTEANLSAVVVALTRAFPGYGEHGLRRVAQTPTIYLTSEAHHGFSKIAHVCGLGRGALRMVPTDSALRMDVAALRQLVDNDRALGAAPFMVVATAGTTAAGAIDPLKELGAFCHAQNLWFHVDAAWGGGAIVSNELGRHLAGIEAADSITCDAHKWLSVSMACGMFFCRHRALAAEAFRADVSYMPGKEQGPVVDPYTHTIQWSRRFIGLKLFLSLAQLGQGGLGAMLEHQARMGDVLRNALADSGWRIVNSSPFPLVCFTRDRLVPAKLLASMHGRQIAWMSEAVLRGEPVLRACVTSYKTSGDDIHWVVREMNQLAAQQAA